MPPELFGRYRLEGLLGQGGMGEVYRAYDTVRDRAVAVKRLLPAYMSDELYRARFFRECRGAAQLNEAHVIPIHDFGEIEGRLFLDMRLVDGRDLAGILSDGPLSADRAVDIVGQVAAALDAAHASGLVHRDVKPSNVLVCDGTSTPHCYLVDFGVASMTGAGTTGSLTRTGMIAGTLDYIAPERLEHHEVDARADVYSLACLLYESLTAQPPFPCDDIAALCFAHVFRQPPRPSEAVLSVPKGLDGVVARGMAKDPAERYASAGDLARAARDAVRTPTEDSPVPSRSTALPVVPRPRPPHVDERREPERPDDRSEGDDSRTVDARIGVRRTGLARRRSHVLLWSVLIVVVLVGASAAGGALLAHRPDAHAATTVRAEPAGTPGEDPYVAKAPEPGSAATASEAGQPPVVAPGRSVSGGTPGLYGGTGSNTCDPEGMAAFLDEQPDRGRAWAEAEGIPVSTIRPFLESLTGVVLRTDTAVTNHGYAHGRATSFQAVLQAGTAVLVDAHGVPRARCACGNPLDLPTDWPVPRYVGEPWTGFVPADVTVIERSGTEIPVFVIVDTETQEVRTRPAGTDGDVDGPADRAQVEAATATFAPAKIPGKTVAPTDGPSGSPPTSGSDSGSGAAPPPSTPGSDASTSSSSAGSYSSGSSPSSDTPSSDTPSSVTSSSGDTPIGDNPGDDTPGSDAPGGDTSDTSTSDSPGPGTTDSGTAGSLDSNGSPLPSG